jgi:hypothetical protein
VEKKYVRVIAEFSEDGRITPLEIIWDDDSRYTITKIKDVRRACSTRAGGTGYRYTVIIEGSERNIWLEDVVFNKTIGARWFVEKA